MIDQLLPVIQPAGWQGADHCVCRPFFPDDPQSPLIVTYAVVTPESNSNLMPDFLASSGKTAEEVETESIARWAATFQDLNWEQLELPGEEQPAMAVRGESDIISSILLSNGHLKGMHKHFDSEIIHILIPDRFTLVIHPFSLGLNSLAEGMYQDATANGTQLSPLVFQSMNGVVLSYSYSQGPEEEQGAQEGEIDLVKAAATVIGGAFLMIAAADGTIDNKEIDKFASKININSQSGTNLAHQACAHLVQTDFEVISDFISNGVEPMVVMAVMQKCMEIIDQHVPEQEAAALRVTAIQLAKDVAEASGGGFLGLGSKISKQEKTAMELLQVILSKEPS